MTDFLASLFAERSNARILLLDYSTNTLNAVVGSSTCAQGPFSPDGTVALPGAAIAGSLYMRLDSAGNVYFYQSGERGACTACAHEGTRELKGL